MKRIGIYIRVSTEEQARIQDGSLVSQKARIQEFVDSQNRVRGNWGHVVEFYCDEGKSAKSIKGRPEFQRMLTDVKLGRIDTIIATELSRLSRSIRDFCEIWDMLKKHGASFITLRESFDTTTASGEMMVFNLINYAQYERKQTAERIALNWRSRAKRGLFNGGTIPMGYARNPKNKGELTIKDADAELVRKIFAMFLVHESLRKTCVALKENGIYQHRFINKHGLEKGGGVFSVDRLRSLLTNPAYIGLRAADKDGERQLIPAVWKPIVDRETFDKVQARLGLNKNRYKPETWKKYPFPLTEMVSCGECGKQMGGKSGTGRIQKHYYYGHAQLKDPTKKVSELKCQVKNVRAPRLEQLVLKCLKSVLQDPSVIKKWVEIYQQANKTNHPEAVQELKSMEVEIAKISRKVTNLVQRVSDLPSDISADPFYEQMRALNQKKADMELAKSRLTSKLGEMSRTAIDEAALIRKIDRVVAKLETVPVEQQRPILKELVHNIEIHPMKLKIEIYAPIKARAESTEGPETQKATGTDGLSINFRGNQKTEASILPFDPSRRAGSSTVGNGAVNLRSFELLVSV